MSVYLGSEGRVLLRRSASKTPYYLDLKNSDVNPFKRRFSVGDAHEQFITGDRIEISTTPLESEIPLTMFPDNVDDAGVVMPSIAGFVHVDPLGGLRLYSEFSESIRGAIDTAFIVAELGTDSLPVQIRVIGRGQQSCLGSVSSFSITTSRENIDLTCLSENYRQSYENGLIAGQGRLSCFWDYQQICDGRDVNNTEFAEYLARLCIRVVQGGDFHGFFFLHIDDTNESKSLWYECADCVITNVAVSVEPTQALNAEIEFVTSGSIQLNTGYLPEFIELEQAPDYLLNETGDPIQLENSTD